MSSSSSNAAATKQLAKLKLDAEIAKHKHKIEELKMKKSIVSHVVPKKAIAKKTAAAAPKAAPKAKAKKPTKPKMEVHHIGPALPGQIIAHDEIVVSPGHRWVVHYEGEGEVMVRNVRYEGGEYTVVSKPPTVAPQCE